MVINKKIKNPLVSVVIPTCNRQQYIKRALESVTSQGYQNMEIIIVDDGSIDGTSLILLKAAEKDSRIKVLTNKNNLGFSPALNRGIKESGGKYIARLDDDDFWSDKRKIEKQIKFLEERPDYVLVGGGMIKIDEESREIAKYLFPEKDSDIRKSILIDNLFAHSSVVFRKDAWDKVGGYDEEIDFFSDWDLWLKLGKVGKFYNFQEYFTYYLEDKTGRADYKIRRKLKLNLKIKKRYCSDYPGFRKAFLLCLANYFYSFLPPRRILQPFCFKLRSLIFGPPAYHKEK